MTLARSVRPALIAAGSLVGLLNQSAPAAITAFYDDHAGWSAAAGDFKTVDFVLGTPQLLGEQYSALGIHFTGGNDIAKTAGSYQDGWGMVPNGLTPPLIEMEFDEPQFAFAIKFPGSTGFTLLSAGNVIWSGSWGGFGPNYLGVVSTIAFDEVHVISPIGAPSVDDLYFSSSIPAPASVVVLAAMFVGGTRRREIGRGSTE